VKEHVNRILELPLQHRLAILIGSMALIIGFYWLYFYSPVSEEVSKLDNEINGKKGLRVQIRQEQNIAQNLERYQQEVKLLDIELKKALEQLPDKKEIHLLLSKVSDKAADAGLEIRLFKPNQEEKRDFYAVVPVEMEVIGTYHQVATFFDEVGHLERIVNLDNFSATEPEITDERISLKTSVIASTFRFLDESERPKPEDQQVKGRRRAAPAKSVSKSEL